MSVAARRRAHRVALFLGHAEGGEALQQPPVGAEHADGGVLRADQVGGHLDHALQHAFQGELRGQERPDAHQLLQAWAFEA